MTLFCFSALHAGSDAILSFTPIIYPSVILKLGDLLGLLKRLESEHCALSGLVTNEGAVSEAHPGSPDIGMNPQFGNEKTKGVRRREKCFWERFPLLNELLGDLWLPGPSG